MSVAMFNCTVLFNDAECTATSNQTAVNVRVVGWVKQMYFDCNACFQN